MFSATSSITSSATSSVTPIQQKPPPTSTAIKPTSSESSNKTSRGQTSGEKMKEMLENSRNKRIQKIVPKFQTSTNSEEEKFQKNLLEMMERQDNLFRESMQSLQENVRTLTHTMTQAFLMMGQIINQAVPRNPRPSHINHQILFLQLPHPSVAKVIPRGILIWGNHQISLRDTVKTMVALRKWERKKHNIHFNLQT